MYEMSQENIPVYLRAYDVEIDGDRHEDENTKLRSVKSRVCLAGS
jgi:hypothetical protein